MMKRDSLGLLSCLPLMLLMFGPGSSCNSTKASKNSKDNANQPMTVNSVKTKSPDLKGTWGAQGISMEVTDNGANLGYDCAHGSITEKIILDGQGHFSATGRHVRDHPGPLRSDEDQNGQRATYTGSVNGDTMNLTVTLSDSHETVGTYTLTHGRSGRIHRCG